MPGLASPLLKATLTVVVAVLAGQGRQMFGIQLRYGCGTLAVCTVAVGASDSSFSLLSPTASAADRQPVPNARRKFYEVMKTVVETGRRQRRQTPSIGCWIKMAERGLSPVKYRRDFRLLSRQRK